jgi:hypothetical protein
MSAMRASTLRKIDELHAQIDFIIRAEVAMYDAAHPDDNWIQRQVAHTGIEHARLSPKDRAMFVYAEARLP